MLYVLFGLGAALILERVLGGDYVLVASGPHGSGNASGSIGADTYSHNRFGQYVRNRTKPVNPNTARQIAVRSALAQLTDRWAQILTDAQRTAWNLYAAGVVMKNALGEDILLTGFNHYLRSNVIAIQAGMTVVDDGPTVFELPDQDPLFSQTSSEATQAISFVFDDAAAWVDEDDAYLVKFEGMPQNPQRNFFAGPWRLIGTIAGDSASPPTTPDEETPIPYAITEGQRLWCYGRIRRADGRLSAPFQSHALVSA